jgi:predicted NAD/FAD-binding protein
MSTMGIETRAANVASGGRQRIAVVGGGISGLTTAYLLAPRHDVTLFEANDYPGGHTNTVTVEIGGEVRDVDTGFIVFNERNYPNFSRLLEILDVPSQPTCMSFSVRCDRTGTEYNGTSLNGLFAQRSNLFRPRFHGMLRDIVRFNREAKEEFESLDEGTTVAEWVEERGYGRAFIEHYLVPMGAALWSSPPDSFRGFPIRFVIEFFANHSMLDLRGRPVWRVIRGGSKQYVAALTESFADRIRLNTPVKEIRRETWGVRLRTVGGENHEFDHVVLACHADQALRMLTDPSETERELLGAFPYQPNEAVLHTDKSVLPRRPRAQASWNYRLPAEDPDRAAVTYDMNRLMSLDSDHRFFVTLNDASAIDPAKVLRTFQYHHPVYVAGRARAQRRHHELIGVNRTSFCGAYWGYGFHEDGVRSALRAASVFGGVLS